MIQKITVKNEEQQEKLSDEQLDEVTGGGIQLRINKKTESKNQSSDNDQKQPKIDRVIAL